MKSMSKRILAIASVVAVSGMMMASTVGAVDKLVVKDSGGTVTKFSVSDTGATNVGGVTVATPGKLDVTETIVLSGTTQASPLIAGYNSGLMRSKLRIDGVQEWYMNSGSAEAGKLAYATPGGGVGIALWTGASYINKFAMINYADNYDGTGVNPVFTIGYDGMIDGITIGKTGVGMGYTWTPRATLEVNGTLMVNDTPADGGGWKATKPTCSAAKDGGLFYTVGGAGVASKLELCQKAAGGTYSWVLVK
jgi:hypothetical protein